MNRSGDQRSEPAVPGRHGTLRYGGSTCASMWRFTDHTTVVLLPVLAAVQTVGALVYTVLAWKDSYGGIA